MYYKKSHSSTYKFDYKYINKCLLNIHMFSLKQAVERRGEMIVRILEPRCIGGKHAVEAAHKLMSKGDARHTVQVNMSDKYLEKTS